MKKVYIFLIALLLANGAGAQIIHVPGDFPSIQQGINAASNGDTVLVSNGIYYEQINFLGKAITVASNFLTTGDQTDIDNTIIDGSLLMDPDSSSVVYFINGEDTTSVIFGFTLRNGNIGTAAAYPTGGYLQSGGAVYIFGSGAKIMYNHITQNNLNGVGFKTTGAGISAGQWWEDDHWVVIDHNTIDYNSTSSNYLQTFGTGICVTCNARITNNVISNNECHGTGTSIGSAAGFFAGGEAYWPDLTAVVNNNVIQANTVTTENNYGGGPAGFFQCISAVFSNNTVEDNEANINNSNASGGVGYYGPRTGALFSANTFRNNTTSGKGAAIYLEYVSTSINSDTVLVEGNYFIGNISREGGALATLKNPVLIRNNVFTLNHGSFSGGSLYITGNNSGHTAILVNNSFFQNSTVQLGGAIYSNHGRPLIINSIFWNDEANTGPEIYMSSGDSLEIAYTDIDMSLISGGTVIDGGSNINEDPLFEDELLTIANGSPCVDSGTEEYTFPCGHYIHSPLFDINGNPRLWGVDMGAHEVFLSNIIHIPVDYPTIQQGIAAALPGDLVLVSDGTYYEQINFLGKAITVASEFIIDGDQGHIENTIIDGSQIAGDSCSVVYFISGEDTTSVLCGFTIQGGHGTMWQYGRHGGGISCFSGASILNNIIQDNKVIVTVNGGAHGGGIFAFGGPAVHILNNTIRYNLVECQSSGQYAAAGGGIFAGYSDGSRYTVSGNLMEENEARASSSYLALGGGIMFEEISVLCENNIFKNNASKHTVSSGANGGALHWYMYHEGSCIRNNSFTGNTSEQFGGAISIDAADSVELLIENNYYERNTSSIGGALCTWNNKLLIQNNVFNGNMASNQGGACYLNYSGIGLPQGHNSVLINNSFYNNHSSTGGAILSINTRPLILNSIFWNDVATTGPEIFLSGGDSLEVAYTDIDMSLISGDNVIDGGGNIPGSDPLFMSPDFLMLSSGSPCIDQGTVSYTCNCGIPFNCPEYDILNTDRTMDDAFDMGAYEWYLGVGISPPGKDPLNADIYPNPTCGIVNLQFTVYSLQSVVVKIYNTDCREVATVLEKQLPAGQHTVQFDVSGLPSGIYFLKSTVDSRQLAVKKIIKI
jgi:hypothetical protein